MRWLGDKLHSMDLKFGMYSDAGPQQCCSRFYGPSANDGSLGHEKADAVRIAVMRLLSVTDTKLPFVASWLMYDHVIPWCHWQIQFTSWGVDYLKHDGCGGQASSYTDMRDALNATGRP